MADPLVLATRIDTQHQTCVQRPKDDRVLIDRRVGLAHASDEIVQLSLGYCELGGADGSARADARAERAGIILGARRQVQAIPGAVVYCSEALVQPDERPL